MQIVELLIYHSTPRFLFKLSVNEIKAKLLLH